MADKPNAFHTLGLEFNSTTLKGAQLSVRKGKPFLVQLYEVPLSPSSPENVKPLYTDEQGKALLNAVPKNLVVTLLNPGEALVRQLEVKLKKAADIDAVLTFQSEPLLPYPVENALVDRITLSETQDGTLLTILAVRKDHLKQHLDFWNSNKIEPEVVSAPPIALAAFSELFAPSEQPQFVVHMGHLTTACVLVKGGKLLAAQACFQGVDTLWQSFTHDMQGIENDIPFSSLDFATLKKEVFPSLTAAVDAMRLDITRTLYALAKQTKGQEVARILITGEAGPLNHLASVLCQPMNKPLIKPTVTSGFDISVSQLEKFAIVIGGALTALTDSRDEIDFRQGEFAYPNPWKRYKTPIAIYLALCCALAAAFYFLSYAYIHYQNDEVRKEYSALLESMHKPYAAFEKEYTAKLTGKKPTEITQVTPINKLDQADIMGRIRYLEKELQSNPQSFPLLPNVPTVSDVLAWLSTHPNVVAKDPKTGALKPLLQIENFSYTFVKRPEMTKKQEKYQVKVEIEFSSPTAKLAREFHDALIAPNSLVDPKGEVKWSTNRGLYRASFYLKDKTTYSS